MTYPPLVHYSDEKDYHHYESEVLYVSYLHF